MRPAPAPPEQATALLAKLIKPDPPRASQQVYQSPCKPHVTATRVRCVGETTTVDQDFDLILRNVAAWYGLGWISHIVCHTNTPVLASLRWQVFLCEMWGCQLFEQRCRTWTSPCLLAALLQWVHVWA